jgi:hypothetical protein
LHTCALCGKFFAQKCHLIRHAKVHGVQPESVMMPVVTI